MPVIYIYYYLWTVVIGSHLDQCSNWSLWLLITTTALIHLH